MIIEIGLVAATLGAIYAYRKTLIARLKGVEVKAVSGVSAFAKVADAEGKLIALKAVTEAKKIEAAAVHAGLDELHKILG